MENLLLKYMTERFNEPKVKDKEDGPVITISRDHGCNAEEIAELLQKKLNARIDKNIDSTFWKCIDKEVIEKSAQYLKSHPESISHFFDAKTVNLLGEIAASFSNNKYVSDSKIKNTISSVIFSYAEEGYNIIIGRAGCYIAKNIIKSLHIKLIAPFDWRVEQIMKINEISKQEAKNEVLDIDKKRNDFMNFYKKTSNDDVFHLTFNTKLLSKEEIVDAIFILAKKHLF